MWELILLAQLQGGVSTEYGRVGVRVSKDGGVSLVHPHSPAATAGIQKGDIIVMSDGVKGIKHIDGDVGTTASLVVRRGAHVLKFKITRVSPAEIY